MNNGGGMYFRCWAEGLVEQSDRAGKQKSRLGVAIQAIPRSCACACSVSCCGKIKALCIVATKQQIFLYVAESTGSLLNSCHSSISGAIVVSQAITSSCLT